MPPPWIRSKPRTGMSPPAMAAGAKVSRMVPPLAMTVPLLNSAVLLPMLRTTVLPALAWMVPALKK